MSRREYAGWDDGERFVTGSPRPPRPGAGEPAGAGELGEAGGERGGPLGRGTYVKIKCKIN